jgi:hypothetical protein
MKKVSRRGCFYPFRRGELQAKPMRKPKQKPFPPGTDPNEEACLEDERSDQDGQKDDGEPEGFREIYGHSPWSVLPKSRR